MTGCPIPDARGTLQPEGLGTNGVLILGESLGDHEREAGLPFRPEAPAGSVLERAIRRSGFSRDQFVLWNVCFPSDTIVQSPGNIDVTKRLYDGPIVALHTSRGMLTGTPNHPALTTRGWIALGSLQDGDDLICGPLPEWVGGCNPHIYNSPTSIKDVFDAAAKSGIRHRIIGSYMDFHGDGMNREIDIIRAECFLWCRNYASLFKHLKEWLFEHSPTLTPYRTFKSLCATLPQHLRPLFVSLDESDGSILPLPSGSWVPYKPIPISLRNCLKRDFVVNKNLAKGLHIHTESGRQMLKRVSESVPLAKIRKIEWSEFSGHVYNLHTTTGHYMANGFVVSNCPVQPPKNWLEGAPYEAAAIAWGIPQVQEVIDKFKPRAILALGNIALKSITQLSGIMSVRGYPVPSIFNIPVIGSIHPSFLRRGAMSYLGVLMHDLRFAVALSRAVYTNTSAVEFWSPILWRQVRYDIPWPLTSVNECRPESGYLAIPSEQNALDFLHDAERHPDRLLAYDIETPYGDAKEEDEGEDEKDTDKMLSIQFSVAPATGIFMPWRDPFIDVGRAILTLPCPKVGANSWRFDGPKLLANGAPIGGQVHDLRWAWKHFNPDLRASLQFITSFYSPGSGPWKHLAQVNPQWYGIRDVDMTLRCV